MLFVGDEVTLNGRGVIVTCSLILKRTSLDASETKNFVLIASFVFMNLVTGGGLACADAGTVYV
jgi:hypothetical protein